MVSTNPDRLHVPDGAPAWVDADLIARTIETWGPMYRTPLTEEEALGIILRFAQAAEGWRWS